MNGPNVEKKVSSKVEKKKNYYYAKTYIQKGC
jgi:hypothetical protein